EEHGALDRDQAETVICLAAGSAAKTTAPPAASGSVARPLGSEENAHPCHRGHGADRQRPRPALAGTPGRRGGLERMPCQVLWAWRVPWAFLMFWRRARCWAGVGFSRSGTLRRGPASNTSPLTCTGSEDSSSNSSFAP